MSMYNDFNLPAARFPNLGNGSTTSADGDGPLAITGAEVIDPNRPDCEFLADCSDSQSDPLVPVDLVGEVQRLVGI